MGILDVIGNIPSDAADIVTGIPKFVGSLPHQMAQVKALTGFSGPQEFQKATQETGINFGDTSLGGYLRNAARTPVFNAMVPGLHTAANLTNEQGRGQMFQHPLSTALDVVAAATLAGAGISAGASPAIEIPGLQQANAPTGGWGDLLKAVQETKPREGPSLIQQAIEKMHETGPLTGDGQRLYDPSATVNYDVAFDPNTMTHFDVPGLVERPGYPSGELRNTGWADYPLDPGQATGPFQDVQGNAYPPMVGRTPPVPPVPSWVQIGRKFGGVYEPDWNPGYNKIFTGDFPIDLIQGAGYYPRGDVGFPGSAVGPMEDLQGNLSNLRPGEKPPPPTERPAWLQDQLQRYEPPNSWGMRQWLRFLGRPENMTDAQFNDLADTLQNSMEGKRFGELRGAARAVNRGTANNPWTRGGPFYDIAPQSKMPLWMTAGVAAASGGPDLLHAMQGLLSGGGERSPSGNFIVGPKGEKLPFEPGDTLPGPGYTGPFDSSGRPISSVPAPGGKNRPWAPDYSYSSPREHTSR